MSDQICYVHNGPQREIASSEDLALFLDSDTFRAFTNFISEMNECLVGKKLSDCNIEGLAVEPYTTIVSLLQEMSRLCDQYPPISTDSRFGNPAYRLWFDAACELIRTTLKPVVEESLFVEVCEYLTHSIGNKQRIDYGTGHEAHFIAFLFCLVKLETFKMDERLFLIFFEYINMINKVQSLYWLEPAGSLGVWGLDDYHFLTFYFASAQLIDHPHLKPKSIHEPEVREHFRSEYLYYSLIQTIIDIKGPFLYQHSPMLDDISSVKEWRKVNTGLLKMYKAEVLSKLPVMQHFIFGRLLPFKARVDSSEHIKEFDDLHIHQGDCCGNAIPSAYSVRSSIKDNLRNIPSLPFD